jgi:hypothetical protein
MSHLQRVSCIIGTLLLGISATLLFQKKSAALQRPVRRGKHVPVEELAEDLKHAWADRHTP